MSQQKLTLGSLGKRHVVVWPWVAGVVTLVLVLCVWGALPSHAPEDYTASDPIGLDSMGMQEWDQLHELTRQVMVEDDAPKFAQDTEPENADPFLIRGKILRNQTLFVALKNHNLDVGDIHQMIAAMQEVVDFKKSRPGDRYEVHIDVDRRILKFVYEISPEDISLCERKDNAFVAQKVDVHKREERIYVHGKVTSSLYQAILDQGQSGELASELMRLFKYDIDFGTRSQEGDSFGILVDRVTLNGAFYRYGRVWAAHYESGALRKRLEAYYYDSDSEYAGYYNASGQALKKTYLKTPVVGCPMTSPFNPKRMHPILKRVRPHNGVDWACQTGTPVMAFADGVVTYADWKGGNGNLLVIEHAHGYTSYYSHLYAFGIGIRKGMKVKQGQVVAQVGTTGLSTGPHLHFAIKKHGQFVDPLKIDTSYSVSLAGGHLKAYQASREALMVAMRAGDSGKAETASSALANVAP